MSVHDTSPIRICNPRRLGQWQLPAVRIPVGLPGDYKPKMALLSNGELLMLAFCQIGEETSPDFIEPTVLWRSIDGGLTWSERAIVEDAFGREHGLTCTSDGTLFFGTHLHTFDRRNTDGVTHSYLHRSTDGGRTWQKTKLLLDNKKFTGGSSTVVEVKDGTLLFGVTIIGAGIEYLWRSTDKGESWDKGEPVQIGPYRGEPYDQGEIRGFFTEDFTYLAKSGKLLHWIRVGDDGTMYDKRDGIALTGNDDQTDRILMCESLDEGRTWGKFRDFGRYGMIYPRATRLRDGRLLMTYTQRALYYPLGLRAIISYDDGESWDFDSDEIIIEGKTPWGHTSGGGFGNTVELPDGALVSCYSYRGADDTFHIEVVRWELPAS